MDPGDKQQPVVPVVAPGTPEGWKRPSDVMRRFHVHKVRARALHNRLTSQAPKNPFKKSPTQRQTLEASSKRARVDDDDDLKTSDEVLTIQKGNIPVDWKLRTRARFLSEKPLPCFHKMKTSEQASGITGFVRCMSNERLDSGASARFHECCLVWQTPVLPWLELCPRPPASTTASITAQSGVKDALHRAWAESFFSVFQMKEWAEAGSHSHQQCTGVHGYCHRLQSTDRLQKRGCSDHPSVLPRSLSPYQGRTCSLHSSTAVNTEHGGLVRLEWMADEPRSLPLPLHSAITTM